jgi:DNA-directed RNA polymerase specialized sigma24 family protein
MQADTFKRIVWFSRCRRLLHFTACRVLGGAEGAELAVQNCWLTASRNRPTLNHEGAFRSWLFRILIDEALAVRREAKVTRNLSARAAGQQT